MDKQTLDQLRYCWNVLGKIIENESVLDLVSDPPTTSVAELWSWAQKYKVTREEWRQVVQDNFGGKESKKLTQDEIKRLAMFLKVLVDVR